MVQWLCKLSPADFGAGAGEEVREQECSGYAGADMYGSGADCYGEGT